MGIPALRGNGRRLVQPRNRLRVLRIPIPGPPEKRPPFLSNNTRQGDYRRRERRESPITYRSPCGEKLCGLHGSATGKRINTKGMTTPFCLFSKSDRAVGIAESYHGGKN